MLCALSAGILVLVLLYLAYDVISRKPLLGNIANRAVFITGCDSGFGAALSRRLDALGVRVFAGCLTEEGAVKLRDVTSTRLTAILLDITDTGAIIEAYKQVKESLSAEEVLWGVVNNAGVSMGGGPLDFLTRRDFQRTFEVNVFGMAEVSRIFLPLLKQSRGRLVNMTSIAGVQATSFEIPYSASKYAAEGLSYALRRSLYIWGISVHIIEPAFYMTQIINKELYLNKIRAQWDRLTPELREEYGEDYLQKSFDNFASQTATANPCLDGVIDAYQHALFARRPRLHYPVSLLAKLIIIISSLPTSLIDAFMKIATVVLLPKVLQNK